MSAIKCLAEGGLWGHTVGPGILPCFLLGHRVGHSPGAKLGRVGRPCGCSGWNISSQRGSGSPGLAACSLSPAVWWHPASPSSLRASLGSLAVPVSANSRGTKRESRHQHQIPTAALGPAGQTGLVTGSQCPPQRVSVAQGLTAAVPATGELSALLQPPRALPAQREPEGEGCAQCH